VKIARMIALAAIAALALSASLGAATASATPTALCKSGTDSPYCKSEDRYPANTALKASSSGFTMASDLGGVTCSESALEAETSAESGEPLPIALSAWTFGGCKYENGSSCSKVTMLNMPSTASLTRTTSWNGTLTLGNGSEEGQPRVRIVCSGYVNCSWALPSLSFEAGNPAHLTIPGVLMSESGSGVICPESVSFSGTYTLNSPLIAFAARAEAPPSPTTGLCKGLELYCEPGNLYPKGTEIKAASTAVTFENGSYGYGDLTCGESSLVAKTNAAYGEPLSLENTQFTLGGSCHFNGSSTTCTMTNQSPYIGSLSRTGGSASGAWKGGGASWRQACAGIISCTFTIASGSTITIEGGSPGAVKLKKVKLEISGSLCPKTSSLSGTYSVSTPNPFWVTDVER
jgi:hypothetical protein